MPAVEFVLEKRCPLYLDLSLLLKLTHIYIYMIYKYICIYIYSLLGWLMQQRLIECQGFKKATKKKLTWVWKDLESLSNWRRDACTTIIHFVTKHWRNAPKFCSFPVLYGTIRRVCQWCNTVRPKNSWGRLHDGNKHNKYHHFMYKVRITECTYW